MKNPRENQATLNIWSRNVTRSTREPTTRAWISANIWRQDGAICSKNRKIVPYHGSARIPKLTVSVPDYGSCYKIENRTSLYLETSKCFTFQIHHSEFVVIKLSRCLKRRLHRQGVFFCREGARRFLGSCGSATASTSPFLFNNLVQSKSNAASLLSLEKVLHTSSATCCPWPADMEEPRKASLKLSVCP